MACRRRRAELGWSTSDGSRPHPPRLDRASNRADRGSPRRSPHQRHPWPPTAPVRRARRRELAGRAIDGDLHGLIGQGHGDPPAVPCHPRPARRGQRPENQRRLRARIRRAPEQRQAGQHGHRTHQPKSAVRGHQPSQHQRAQDRAGRLRRRQQPHRLRLTAQARGVRGGQPPPEPRRSRTAMPGQLGRAAVGYRRPDASRPEKSPTATGSPRPTGRPPTGEPGARGRRRPTAAGTSPRPPTGSATVPTGQPARRRRRSPEPERIVR